MKPQLLSYFTFNQLTDTHPIHTNHMSFKPRCKPIKKSTQSSGTNNHNHKEDHLPKSENFEETEFLNSLVSIVI